MPKSLISLCLLIACSATAVADDIYQKQAAWVDSLVATRQKLMQLQLRNLKPAAWHVSEALPAKDLAEKLFPEDQPDLKAKDAQKRPLFRDHRDWKDGQVIGLNNRPQSARYLYREFQSGEGTEAEITWGCDCPTVIWWNGEVLHRGSGAGTKQAQRETLRVSLQPGANRLLIKLYAERAGGEFWFDLPAAKLDPGAVYESLCRSFWEDFPETDWFLQDSPFRDAKQTDCDSRRDFGWYFAAERDSQGEQQLIGKVLAELGEAAAPWRAKLEALVKAQTSVADPAWLKLYVEVCTQRRSQRLAPVLAATPRIVFTKHYTMGGSHYAYTEAQSDAQAERNFVPGTALCLLTWDGREARVENLVEDADGVIRDPDVSYDGKRVLFAWKKSNLQDDYHLYELDIATRQIRQLTQGLGVVDYEGAYLPDGDIIFNSTRCVQTVDCWWTEVSNLYRCDKDGRFMRRLTFDQVHDNFPTVTEDNRILYTRWEYNDRGQIYPQPLLQMNPDGTNQMDFYGGNSWFPTTILHARGVPGTQKVLAIATGHHSRQTGKLILIDPAKGRQENQGVQLVAPVRETPAVRVDSYGQEGELFQNPYPLSETEYLVTYHPVGWRWTTGYGPRFGIYYMTCDGRRELLASDAKLPCNQSVPLRPRDARGPRPSLVDYRQTHGMCYVQDVYAGLGLKDIPRGTVKTLRIIELDFRAAGVGSNGNGGPGGGALVSTPVAIGNGTWDPKSILGDTPVYEDGSAFFRVPARRPIYFQCLDENGRMVQSMRSWTTIQPGECASCVGCHEDKNSTPVADPRPTVALRYGAKDLKPFYGEARGFSFRREVQPILDRQCVRCHDGTSDKPINLTATEVEDNGARRRWTESYLALTHSRPDNNGHGWRGNPDGPVLSWISAQSAPPMLPPLSAGSNKSRLITSLEKRGKGHEDVKLSPEELHKLAAWIDLGVPFCGDYVEANNWTPGELEKYQRYAAKRQRLAEEDRANIAAWLQQASQRADAGQPASGSRK